MSLLGRARAGQRVPTFGGAAPASRGARGPAYADLGIDQGAAAAVGQFISDLGSRVTGEAADERFAQRIKSANAEGLQQGGNLARQVADQLTNAKAGEQFTFPALPLRNDQTDEGAAFDNAVGTAYLTNLDVSAEAFAQKLATEHPDDPAAFTQRWQAAGDAMVKQLPVEMQAGAGAEWQKKGLRHVVPISVAARQKSLAEANAQLVTAADEYQGRALNAWRADDADGVDEWDQKYRQTIAARTDLDAREKAAVLLKYEQSARAQTAFGHFDAAKSRGLGAAETWLRRFEDPEASPVTDPTERDALARHMRHDLGSLKAERQVQLAQLHDDRRVAEEAMLSGRQFPALDQLRARAKALGDADTLTRLEAAQGIARDVDGFAKQSLTDQRAEIERRRLSVATAADNARLDNFERIYRTTVSGVQSDPLAFAEAVGARKMAPLDISNPKALGASLAARVEDAKWAEKFYGLRDVSPLKKVEVDALTMALDNLPAVDKAQALGAMTLNLGPQRLPSVLEQLHLAAPSFAHAGAIAMQGDMGTASDILLGEEVSRTVGKADGATPKMYLPTGAGSAESIRLNLVSAMPEEALRGIDPAVRQGVDQAVMNVYAAMAYKAGDANHQQVNPERLKQAVQKVTGGFVEFRGAKVLAPVRGMNQDDFDKLVKGVLDQDMGYAVSADGTPVTAGELRKYGNLVGLGNGRYAVMIGGKAVADPTTAKDPVLRGRFVLDLGALAARRQKAGG